MLKTLIGQKKEMAQTYVEDTRVPVTQIQVGPCIVTQVKTVEKDGYRAVQLGLGEKKLKNVTKPLQGHLKLSIKDKKAPRFLVEVRLEKETDLKVGDVVNVGDVFKRGDLVTISGTSKGKGFQGGVKRWGFAGGPKTHGQSDRQRAPGSIGQGTTPGRVLKGKKMAGRMGNERITIKNLIIVFVDNEKNIIEVSGPVPGNRNGLLEITKTASGKLSELVEETPQVVVQQVEEAEGSEEGKVEEEKQPEQEA